MEWLVQEVLNFKCFVTTTHHFLWYHELQLYCLYISAEQKREADTILFKLCRFYLKAAKADDRVADLANYMALLSLLNHKLLSFWPSTVAAAVVALACLATNRESSCHLVMEVNKQVLQL